MLDYISLHNHSFFSITHALPSPLEMMKRAQELGQNAIGITDFDTMAGVWDALKASKKTGVKLIIGCEVNFVPDLNNQDDTRLYQLVLIAKNHIGYKNLLFLRKQGFNNYIVHLKRSFSRIDWELLQKHSEGLICLSGGGNGYIPQLIMQNKTDEVKKAALKFKEIFGEGFALELQPNNLQRRANAYSGSVDQRKINRALKKISEELEIQSVVATDSHYLQKQDHKSHDVLLAIGSGQPLNSGQRLIFDKPEFHMRTALEVAQYFLRHKNTWGEEYIKSLFSNTIKLADSCESPDWIDPSFGHNSKELPIFPVKDQEDYQEFLNWKSSCEENQLDEDVLYYRYLCYKGLEEKINNGQLDSNKIEFYNKNIKEELEVLEYHGFSSYMLIVADYINWSKKNGVAVGPGRGSVGGAFTAYLVGIHDSNPFTYKLIFSRFHNKWKTSFPDIDTDFSPEHRERLHIYIRNKYGDDYIAHVSNVNTITPKVYARDVARVYEFGGQGRTGAAAIGNDIADSISDDAKTVKKALQNCPLFGEFAKQYPQLSQHADLLSGKPRAWSTHAAGLVISRRPLHEIVPIRRDSHGNVCLELDKDRAEEMGLVKMDTLGLETLDIIHETYELIKKNGKTPPPEPFDYGMDDPKSYDLISRGDTFGVFQLTGVAAPVCKALKPRNVAEIALVTALIRPNAKGFINDFLKVRSGAKPIDLPHPRLEKALENTYGFGLYEECLMYIAMEVPGWDLHEADRLRKMTKAKGKDPEKDKKLREDFINDATNNGFSRDEATVIWDDVVGSFNGYGFNASHATLYSMITFHTAYLKANFPLEFLVANLMSKVNSNVKSAKDDIIKIKNEIRNLGVKIVPPDINKSDVTYKIIDDKTLMTGLDSLKYMGSDAIPELLSKRPFADFHDFMTRIDAKKVRAPSIQALAACGALDSFGIDRKIIFHYVSDYRKKLQALSARISRRSKADKITPEEVVRLWDDFEYPFPNEKSWRVDELAALEEYYLGEPISGTVYERYNKFFDTDVTNFAKFAQFLPYQKFSDDEKEDRRANTHSLSNNGVIGFKGIVTHVFSFKVKKEDSKIFGQVMARMDVEDPFGNLLHVVIFPESWERAQQRINDLSRGKQKIEPGIAVFFNGQFQWENAHTYSFIMGDILSYKPPPPLPKDLKPKKVKMPRAKNFKVTKKEVKKLDNKQLVLELENEALMNGQNTMEED